jgi:hypothetical protein
MRRAFLSVALASCLAAFLSSHVQAQRDLALPPKANRSLELTCGTDGALARQLLGLRLTAVAAATPISFRQEPAVLRGDWEFSVALRDFTVLGDVPTIRFALDAEGAEIETWTRTETREIAGHLVSIFNPTWPVGMLRKVLRGNSWGWDVPRLHWGEVLGEGVEPGNGKAVYLRIAPDTLPAARVVRVSDDLQYSGNVVNVVMPTFADGVLDDEYGFDLAGAAQRFYRNFEDTYDDLAMVPQDTFFASYSAYHSNIRNQVRGIGLGLFDRSATYGSTGGRLQGVEVFLGSQFALHSTSSHEIAHQWGDYINWTRLSGLVRSGWQPASHDPLWAPGETLIGSVLTATRRVAHADDGWKIERTPAPTLFHPFTLYAMGLIPKDDVPEITLFDDQAQFNPVTTSTPATGTLLSGTTQTATIYNVIGMLGERSGPVPAVWNRATVVVSRDALLSQREMDYWNYFAQRLADPQRSGVVGYNGVGSFRSSTGGRVELATDIRPLVGERVDQVFDVSTRSFAPRDLRDVIFDEPIPMRYHVGDRIRWSGRIDPPDRSDINQLLIRFTRSTDGSQLRMWTDIGSRASFVVETTFEPKDAGIYVMEVFLFWPGSGAQFSRAAITPILID